MSWDTLADAASWFFLAYFVALGAGYLLVNVCSVLELPRQRESLIPSLLPRPHSNYELPVSVIVPAHDEEAIIAASVHSVLQLEYPLFEVIVVNDGSRDGTLEALRTELELVPFPEAYRQRLAAKPVRGVYRSARFPNVRVIDKENGGKADATNAGVNAARYPLVCIVDADSILERSSLRQVAVPFLIEPHIVAVGGSVRIVNGSTVRGGFLEEVGLSRKMLPLFQVVEYLRAFLFGRAGWAPLNAVPIVSGAFGAFRKEALVDAGGYHSGSLGEDMELVLRLHRRNRLARRKYRIAFLINPICWTDAPESLGVLRGQRIRWQRGLGESLARNRALLFHPRGGAVGWVMFPFMIASELLGPVVELAGYLFMILGFAFGFISAWVFWSFLALAVSIGLMLSASALLLEEVACHVYKRPSQLLALTAVMLLENFGYHQLVLLWRLQGLWRWLVGAPATWGDTQRGASWQKEL